MKTFNINCCVRVKLTEYGKNCLARNHFEDVYPTTQFPPPVKYPREDADGWSRWQLWDLMYQLGKWCGSGKNPFETEIQIEMEDSCIAADERYALRQMLNYAASENGKSQKGYYSEGWCGQTLHNLLERSKS